MKPTSAPLQTSSGITDGGEIAQGFCDFYCKVGPELASKITKVKEREFSDYMGEMVQEDLIWRPTTPDEVEELCKGLEPGKGMGWDGISPRVIKAVSRELAAPLSRLYNYCMREGYYPPCFKVARIVPIFKAEDPTKFSNYRPVSVLPVLSQIFERILKVRLTGFFDKHKVIVPGQYGFRNKHSTAMAILDMVEKVRAAWDRKDLALGVFIDLKKAFDTVDHKILIRKLEHYGVRGDAVKLLESYLRDRTQYVSYGGFESERGHVECGVPQGSVLGPLFFIIYVNDMVRASPGLDLVLFADDTSKFARGKDPVELFGKVNRGLEELSKWFRCNKLTLNLKKTEYIFFCGPKGVSVPQGGLHIGGVPIDKVEGVRFLGVWVDEGLRWTGHIEKVRSKVNRLLGVLGRAQPVLGGGLIKMLYNALVLPHLQYCLLIWGDFEEGRNKKIGESLLKCQKRLVGLMAEKTGKYHADPVFSHLGILKIGDLYKLQLRVYAWQFMKGLLPESQGAILSKTSEVHGHNTRSAGVDIYVSTQDQRSIGNRIPREWRLIPDEIKKISSLNAFKRKSKGEFIANYKSFRCNVDNCYVCINT